MTANNDKIKNTTLCYIERDGKYLMMHRVKKENDVNHGKWIGIGGKFERGETAFDCAKREIKEETGLTVDNLCYRGVVTFISDIYETEIMHLFTSKDFSGEIDYNCDEGILKWVDKEEVLNLNLWEGDRIFLALLKEDGDFFDLTLIYKGDKLVEHKFNK